VTRLSKSRIMSSLQCLRRVHLEVSRPELARYSKKTEAAFAVGHEVGDVAVRLYGGGRGTYIEYAGDSLGPALKQTRQLLNSQIRAPVFEATLEYDGVLVREDVLLPTIADGQDSWRIVEVKAATKLKPEYVQDCAVQAWVHRQSGYPLARVALAHVDNTFVYPGDGRYEGLLVEHDLTEQVFELLPAVPRWVETARTAVAGPLPEVPPGQHCTKPHACPFMHVCWPVRGEDGVDYPIAGLGGRRQALGAWLMNGYRDLREVPVAEITNATQLRIHSVTRSGKAELLSGAREFAGQLPYPRYYLDFETIGPPVPLWAGTRPYQPLPFQWSCHVERAPGVLDHAEFLDLSGTPPMRPLAEALIRTLESDGPVLMYTGFERSVIQGLATMLPDLSDALRAIVDRLVDLAPVTKANYYHPDMLGSWSIKAVLPTIAPDLDYAALDGIQEGTEASAAYLEAVHPETSTERREALRGSLLEYCRQDTEAMVRLVRFFAQSRQSGD
jgi:hypothetical protein